MAKVGAKIDKVQHQRAFTMLAAQNIALALVIQTRGRAHIAQVLAARGAEGFEACEPH